MADIITRFKLETTQYDSKLRDAAKGLSEFVKQAEIGGKGFTNFSQKSIEAARALGTVTSGANNLKDKVKDMVGAYNDAAKAYNKLSQEQQQSDFGKALAQSIGQLSERIKDAKQELYGLGSAVEQVKSKAGDGLFGEGGLTGMLAVTGGNLLASGITKLGSEIADTVHQSIELAKSGEGVRLAFERLNQPGLLANLKEATHGTVSELELMKAAVKFDDFKLPVEQLGTLLAFAQKKAKDTGQSVDYMVDSIVTGLGRKSLMILDNLGLSAAQVKERMAETGDMTKAVADIIREEMAKAGDYVETAADRAARAAADAQNQMEELGRKAMPVAEQWASTWATIKTGALDLLNNAITPLINALTEAGRLRTVQQDRGSGGRIAQQISWLQNPGSEGKQSVYDRIIGSYVDEINHARTEYNKLQKDAVWNPFAAWKADKALARLNVIKQEYADFKAQAAPIMNPKNEVTIKTDNAQNDVDSLKKKLRELQAEYKAAIKAGDTGKSNDLLKQINQTKKDIRGLDPNALKTTGTHKTPKTLEQENNEQIQKLTQEYQKLATAEKTASEAQLKDIEARKSAIQNEIGKLQDRNKELARFALEAKGVNISSDSIPALTQQLKELQAAQSESANGKEWDEYQKEIESVTDKINVLKGVLPKDKQATFTLDVNSEQLEQLRMLLPTEDQAIRINVEQGRIELPKVPTDDETIKVNVEQGQVNLPKVPTDDETVKINITADTAEAMKAVRDLVGEIDGINADVRIEAKVEFDEQDVRTSFERLQDSIRIQIAEQNMEVDTNTLQTLMQTAIKNGIDSLNPDFASLQEKMREGINIPDETWQALQDQINEKLKRLGIEPIQIDFSTGNVKKQAKEMSKDWQSAAQAVQTVGSAMESIEDPAAKVMGTIAQAIATIALTYAKSLDKTFTTWDWIAAAAAGASTMISVISTIHSATGYAQGGMIKGNSYSGDNIAGLVDGSQLVGLNAGEIVLNASQQSILASNLQGSGGDGGYMPSHISGEQIYVVLSRFLKRTGRGELVTWK